MRVGNDASGPIRPDLENRDARFPRTVPDPLLHSKDISMIFISMMGRSNFSHRKTAGFNSNPECAFAIRSGLSLELSVIE